MSVTFGTQLHLLFIILAIDASVTNIHGQELSTQVSHRGGDSEGERELSLDTGGGGGPIVTTQSPLSDPARQPRLKDLLFHESLLTKDFSGDQHFFEQPPATPPSSSAPRSNSGDPSSSHHVPHEDAPAFSDIATTITVAATTPMTTVTTAASISGSLVSVARKGTTKGVDRTAEKSPPPTTQALTTPVIQTTSSPISVQGHTHSPSVGAGLSGPKPISTESTLAPPALTTLITRDKFRDNESETANATGSSSAVTTVKSQPSANADEKTTTSTITTTVITTIQSSAPCTMNFTDPEGYIEMPPQDSAGFDSTNDCTYLITVYLGHGIEIQVLNVSLLEGAQVTVEDLGVLEPSALANTSALKTGLVLRSSSNQISIRLSSEQRQHPRSITLRYQAFVLSCGLPKRPANGEVTVSSLSVGGEAFFFCLTGYQLQGFSSLTCRNATTPYWTGREPKCQASCGGMIKNATLGRLVSPGFPGNYSNNLTCHWVLEAPEGHRLHVHFEKVALAEDDDRLLIKNGNNIDSPVVYDSYEVEYLPSEGVLSSDRHLFVEFTTDATGTCTGAAIRYEAFPHGFCYEPFVKYGNFSSSDASFGVGAVVEFSCDSGYTLEQGSVTIECVDAENPQWNDTEPGCRAVCSGEITDSAGVVLSPNWPEAYDKGQDCIWGIHVEEDKRIMLDIQVLHLGKNDMLTFYDGDDLTANILGQYSGALPRFKLYTSMADVTIQFQSDPATNIYGYNNGFVVHFFEVPRNDTCSELPEIMNGWKSTSHPDLIHGTVVTYQCYPGYQLQGSEVLMCQWDLTWSGDVPICEKVMVCPDPGIVEHSHRVITGSRFVVGSTVQYTCNKGYYLSGTGLITCYSRDVAEPKWSERLPKCVPDKYEPCRNPGAPSTGLQNPEKAFYQAGETLSFSCRTGQELQGESILRCVPGHPSQWSGTPPACRASSSDYMNERRLDVDSSDSDTGPGTNIAIAVMVPVAVVLSVILVIYIYFSKLQGKPLQMPTSSLPPYDNMTEESAFSNPIYETGVSMDALNLRDVDSENTIVLS
ncbi:seizure protein 6 homolog isoform X1 [Alosa sapidissima]|uniref:seizure protein 6 homolog isoform X1 n=1 Tax=Alosa sapidissima TaxID=34773 RepID=UPI001C09ADDB|nr:seizure protein 6 homolog isoform X1 [Alosa sapidissima]